MLPAQKAYLDLLALAMAMTMSTARMRTPGRRLEVVEASSESSQTLAAMSSVSEVGSRREHRRTPTERRPGRDKGRG